MKKDRRSKNRKPNMQALRLNKREQREVHLKWMEINKKLVTEGGIPMSESEFLHRIIEMAVPRATTDENNQLSVK